MTLLWRLTSVGVWTPAAALVGAGVGSFVGVGAGGDGAFVGVVVGVGVAVAVPGVAVAIEAVGAVASGSFSSPPQARASSANASTAAAGVPNPMPLTQAARDRSLYKVRTWWTHHSFADTQQNIQGEAASAQAPLPAVFKGASSCPPNGAFGLPSPLPGGTPIMAGPAGTGVAR